MTELVELQEKLELTNQAMDRLARMMRDEPEAAGLIANMNSLRIAHYKLEREYEEAAKRLGVEVCNYRLFSEGTERQTAVGIGKALINFQMWYSIVYDAVKRREPKQKGQLSEEILGETMFDFAYSYPGSVGLALTIPKSSLLENHFHEAVTALSEMAKAQATDDLKEFSRRFGMASVKAMYRWADELVEAGFGVDVQWKGPRESYPRLIVQKPELAALREIIRATSEEYKEEFTKTGTLKGIDVTARTFHFQYQDVTGRKVDIYGKFSDAVNAVLPIEVPATYVATISRTSITKFSTEEDVTTDILLKIEDGSGAEK